MRRNKSIIIGFAILAVMILLGGCFDSSSNNNSDSSTYTLTIGADNGVVNPNPKQDSYEERTTVELTAIANTGYVFSHWQGSGYDNNTNNPLTVQMTADLVLTAVFVEEGQSSVDKVANPIFTPKAGAYIAKEQVAISCATTGAIIEYSIDGGSTWNVYDSDTEYDLNLDETTTVQAKAEKDGMETSDIVTAEYIISDGTKMTAIPLEDGVWNEGETGYYAGDTIWYSLACKAGNRYNIFLDDSAGNNYNGDIMISAYKSDGATAFFTNEGKYSDLSSQGESIVLDADETVYLKLQTEDNSYSDDGTFAVKFATDVNYQAGTWSQVGSSAIDMSDGRYYLSFVKDSTDNLYASTCSSKHPTVVKYDTAWSDLGDLGTKGSYTGVQMAIDSNDNLYAAYVNSSSVYVFKYDGGNWVQQGGFTVKELSPVGIAVSNDVPYVLSRDDNGNLSVKKYNGTSWGELLTTTDSVYDIGDIEVDTNGTVYVSYLKDTSGNLGVKSYSGTSWEDISVTGSYYTGGEIETKDTDVYLGFSLGDGDAYDFANKVKIMKLNSTSLEEVAVISAPYSIRDLYVTDDIYFSTGKGIYHYDLSADDYLELGQFGGNSNYAKVVVDSNGDVYGASAFGYKLEVYKFYRN